MSRLAAALKQGGPAHDDGQPGLRGPAQSLPGRQDEHRGDGMILRACGERPGAAEEPQQFGEVLWELLRGLLVPAQRRPDGRGEAHGTAQTQIDASRVQGLERGGLLCHDQGLVVRQHDPAGAHPDPIRGPGDGGHEQCRGGAGNAGHAVVLGHPESGVSQLLRPSGPGDDLLQHLGLGEPLDRVGAVEEGQGQAGVARGHVRHNGIVARNIAETGGTGGRLWDLPAGVGRLLPCAHGRHLRNRRHPQRIPRDRGRLPGLALPDPR
ncbi:hypothetical protein CITRIK5_70434 [Citricoccus sp. K5]|nr:hypothetical protein CITRIK5_70434 [Citricoccus sp. K5]